MIKSLNSILKKTYLYKGDDPFSSHNRIAKIIVNSAKKDVLDIGCNQGFIGQALVKRGFTGKIIGLDIDKKHQNIKGKYNYLDFIELDVENNLKRLRQKYEVIVLGDVLEHLINPIKVLHNLKQYLKSDGLLIISLPNIANVYFRLHLLFGKFEYSQRGILDKNHLRFYTYNTALKLIEESGLKLVSWEITPIPLPLIHQIFSCQKPLFWAYYLFNKLTKFKPSLFGYQFIFACKL